MRMRLACTPVTWIATIIGIACAPAQAGPLTAGRSTHAARLSAESFADPGLMQASDGRYYLYGTGAGFRVMSSSTMAPGSFTQPRRSMRKRVNGQWETLVPEWVGKNRNGDTTLWAPHVTEILTNPASQRYVMYFNGHSRAHGANCIGVATAASPTGPFLPRRKSLVCARSGEYEAIDASTYHAADGKRYLLYKVGRYAPGSLREFKILSRPLTANGISLAGDAFKEVVAFRGPDAQVVEAPQVFRANGKVWLIVSRFGYKGCDYSTQLWSAGRFWEGNFKVVQGMERYNGAEGMLGMRDSEGRALCGSGGAEVVRDRDGKYRIAFHVWKNHVPASSRVVWGGELRWNARGLPYLY